jgi:hypothetical protein
VPKPKHLDGLPELELYFAGKSSKHQLAPKNGGITDVTYGKIRKIDRNNLSHLQKI